MPTLGQRLQDNNWQRNGQLDSSSPEFNGCKIARAALENS